MFVTRLWVTIILLPLGILAIALGGWVFAVVVAGILALAAWEYAALFRACGYQPAGVLVIVGGALLPLVRYIQKPEIDIAVLSLLALTCMAYHLFAYERGRNQAGTDFAISLAGIVYIGWIGSYLVSLRGLPEGKWWFLTAMPAVWFADAFAYLVGSRWGRRKLSPRLSPKKTWEGFFGGLVGGVILTTALTAVWQFGAGPGTAIQPLRGALLGLVMGIFPTLGDLGESMIKRQAGVKDSSNLIPGHGGVFDRIDSWLWAGVLGYYLILLLWV